MNYKKAVSLCLVVVLLVLLTGCNKSPQDLPTQATGKIGDITDPTELDKLWQEYFYDAITTVANTGNFNTAKEIDPFYIAMFARNKYSSEHSKDSLALAQKGSSLRLLPLEKVLEYASRYFNLTNLDVSKIEKESYDPQKRAFTFGMDKGQRFTRIERNRL